MTRQREALNAALPRVTAFYASIPLDDAIWEKLKVFADSAAAKGSWMQPASDLSMKHAPALSSPGLDLPADQKARVAELESTAFRDHPEVQ